MLRTVITFTLLIVAILLLFRLSSYSLLSGNLKTEFVLAGVALVFFFIGLYLSKQRRNKTDTAKENLDFQKVKDLGLSKREYEVLKAIADGLSNKQIADKLFVSESTIKTHVSNIYMKLDVKRRTQALQKARDIRIID